MDVQLPPGVTPIQVLASVCRDSFKHFVREFWHCIPGASKLVWNWHLDIICAEMEEQAELVFAGKPRDHDTVFNLPFGTSKSSLLSVLFLPWTWTRAPWTKHLKATHTSLLVLDLANKSREVIKSEKYQQCFPDVQFKESNDAKGYYTNTAGGCCFTCTAAGVSPLGLHCHFANLDDIIDPKKMMSEAETATARKFITEIIPTRKDDKAVAYTYLVMQRLGLGDPTDVMIEESKKEGAAKVRHFIMPGEIATDPSTEVKPVELRKFYTADGLMDPKRLPWSVLKEYQARGALFYSTQILQKPYAPTGGMFKETFFLKRVKAAPHDAIRVRSWDRASTDSGGCNTAGTLMARDKDGNFYVGPVKVGQWEPKERDDVMLATAQADRDRFGPNHEPDVVIEHEPGSSGVDAYRYTARHLAGFRVFPERPTGSKQTRAEPWASQCAAGNVYLVESGDWDLQAWIKEHCAFPFGGLMDRVDSASQGFLWLLKKRGGTGVFGVKSPRPSHKPGMLRLMALDYAELETTLVEDPALLIAIVNPTAPDAKSPPHGLAKPAGGVNLKFAGIEPADLQAVWDVPLEPWGIKPAELMMTPAHGKELWRALGRKYAPPLGAIVFASEPVGAALSMACAVADAFRMKRADAVWCPSIPEGDAIEPTVKHVFEQVKASRHLVVA